MKIFRAEPTWMGHHDNNHFIRINGLNTSIESFNHPHFTLNQSKPRLYICNANSLYSSIFEHWSRGNSIQNYHSYLDTRSNWFYKFYTETAKSYWRHTRDCILMQFVNNFILLLDITLLLWISSTNRIVSKYFWFYADLWKWYAFNKRNWICEIVEDYRNLWIKSIYENHDQHESRSVCVSVSVCTFKSQILMKKKNTFNSFSNFVHSFYNTYGTNKLLNLNITLNQ